MPKYIFKRGYLCTYKSLAQPTYDDYYDIDIWDESLKRFISISDFCVQYSCKLVYMYDTLHARETIRLCVFEVIDEKKPGRPKTKLQK